MSHWSTSVFTPPRYWVLPIAFTPSRYLVFTITFVALPLIVIVVFRFFLVISWFTQKLLLKMIRYLMGEKSKEEEEREREQEERIRELNESLKAANKNNRELKEKVDRLNAALQRALNFASAISRTLRQERESRTETHQALRREEEEKTEALLQNQRLVAEVNGLREQLDVKDAELKNLHGELQHAQTKYEDLTVLLDTKGTQVYLPKTDTLSDVEVASLLKDLNSEILQTSTIISNSFDFAPQQARADEIKKARNRTTEFMGSNLTHLLSTVLHSKDPLLVQIALQGASAEFSRWIIMTWDFDGLQAEQPLSEIYSDIRETKSQVVGGRWRALTRAHTQKLAVQVADPHATMVEHIFDTLVIILVAAGCTKSYKDLYREFKQKFNERISNIIKIALRLNKAMGEEVTSADLCPITAVSGDKFDKATMDDFESSAEESQGNAVLCTTALGLQRSEKVVQGDAVEFKTTTLLKPQVAVESIAYDLEQKSA